MILRVIKGKKLPSKKARTKLFLLQVRHSPKFFASKGCQDKRICVKVYGPTAAAVNRKYSAPGHIASLSSF